MVHGISETGTDRSGRKHRMGGEILSSKWAEMPQVRSWQSTRAGVSADTPKPIDGVPLSMWGDLQPVYGHSAGSAPSEPSPSGVAAAGRYGGRDHGSAVAGTGRWLRSGIDLAPRATSPSRTVAADRGSTRYGNRERRNVSKRGGKKAGRIVTRLTHPVVEPTHGAGEARLPMTVRRLSG